MVRYRVGARITSVICAILFMVLGIAVPLAIFISAGFNSMAAIGLLFVGFFITGAIILGVEINYQKRRNFALKGRLSTGVIKEVERIWQGRNGAKYNLIIACHNDMGEQFEASIPISYWDMNRYTAGVKINVYVNGNYCYIKKY